MAPQTAPKNAPHAPKKTWKDHGGLSRQETSVNRLKSELRKHRRVLQHDDKVHNLPANVRQEMERAVQALNVRLEHLAKQVVEVQVNRQKTKEKKGGPYGKVKFFGECWLGF